ncbi:hypothetical protein AC578_1633 [Pseudocercospora eumusae]|uniref:DUF6604 domain-containing protein n=1 Tax=Pseudocercospora eumusae TaxID=321146 RepID=A0A139HLR2_9PEZI|nr:hypothetical protein AC578_1633 [Pseudocercospora eumusae]
MTTAGAGDDDELTPLLRSATATRAQAPRSRLLQRASTEASPSPRPPPLPRRRTSVLSFSSLEDASRSFTDDFLDLRTDNGNQKAENKLSTWHSSPLAFAILPAIAGLLFKNGSAFVTDMLILGLAGIFLNWSIRLPWDWYYSAQALNYDLEPDYTTAADADEDAVDLASSTDSSPKPRSDSKADADAPVQDTRKPELAAAELRRQELLALAAAFLAPILAAYLLHVIRAQLSGASGALVSDTNISVFLLAAEIRPVRQVVRLMSARTLHLQRTITGLDDPFQSAAGHTRDVDDLTQRITDLEAKVLETANGPPAMNVAQKSDMLDLSAEMKKRYEPRLDGLERAVRRYEKRSAALERVSEARFQSLEARIQEALTLAASAAQESHSRGAFARFVDTLFSIITFPINLAWTLFLYPFVALESLYNKTPPHSPSMGLQPLLLSTYRRYKEDEKVFSTWLAQAARACGYQTPAKSKASHVPSAPSAPPAPSARLKGKARKQAKQSGATTTSSAPEAAQPKAVEYSISIAELTKQADFVSSSNQKDSILPSHVEAVLQRAIQGRQKCHHWYSKIGSDKVSDAGHWKFISILQDILGKLKGTGSSGAEPSTTKSTKGTNLSNQFAALGVEEPFEEEFPITAIDIGSQSAGASRRREVYEIEDIEAGQEEVFQLFCFFEDLHALEDHVKAAWLRFFANEISLNVASIITQTAIDIVKRLEKDALVWTNPNHYPLANLTQVGIDLVKLDERPNKQSRNFIGNQTSKHAYANIALPVFYSDAKARGENPDELLKDERILDIKPWHDFIYLPTFRTLLKFADVAHQAFLADLQDWPLPIPPMRMSYIIRPDLLELPGYKEREEDDRTLTQLLHEIFLVDKGKTLMSRFHHDDRGIFHALPDELAKCARNLWHKGTVDMCTVFTSKLVLELSKLGNRSRKPLYVKQLDQARDMADAVLGFQVNEGVLDTGDYRWRRIDEPVIMALHVLVQSQIPNKIIPGLKKTMSSSLHDPSQGGFSGSFDDMPPKTRAILRKRMIERGEDPDDGPTEEHERNARKLNIKMIRANEQDDFFRTHNPLNCGTLSLELTTTLEAAGVALANHHLTIFAMAHLYNAFQQLTVTDIRWPTMGQVMHVQCNALFANDVPKTPADFYRRISYRTGLSRVSRDPSKNKIAPFRTCIASEACKKLLESTDTVEHALAQLEDQIDRRVTISSEKSIITGPKKVVNGRRRQLNPLQLLDRFERFLPILLRDMELDYITLTKTCTKLLNAIKRALNAKLGFGLGVVREAGDSNDHGLLLMVIVILDRVEKAWNVHRLSKSNEPFQGGAELQCARLVFEEFFADHIAPTLSNES